MMAAASRVSRPRRSASHAGTLGPSAFRPAGVVEGCSVDKSDTSERIYHVAHRGQKFGPFSLAELWNRSLTEDMLVWREGWASWLPIARVPELESLVKRSPPTGALRARGRAPSSEEVAPPPPPPISGSASGLGLETPPPAPKSGLPLTMGILNIVMGSLGLLCVPLAVFDILGTDREFAGGLVATPLVQGWKIFGAVIGFATAVLMITAGSGLCRRRKWGRSLSLIYGWFSLAFMFVNLGFWAVVVWVPLARLAGEAQDPEVVGFAGGFVGGGLGVACCGAVYPIALLITMSKSSVQSSLD